MPPEAFFGREGERADIMDRYGSCFVYGGRQLGKTALLHSTQAEFHDPRLRHLAKYIDLKYEDVGVAFEPDRLWQVLWHEFVKLDIIEPGVRVPPRNSIPNAIEQAVTDWLDAHDDGRILLLLDEADAFLAGDLENDFRVSTRLKGLMDLTKRQFKVVLCGLHNVLRNVDRANHPLAHFGKPVCVGPLLENGDLEQARSLIREPMAALGYRFESENLITQILIWTNYYPSLIQLYGEALLSHLRRSPNRDFSTPVTSADIDAVRKREQFHEHIRGRFSLTLQLDPRYEVIAYSIAYELLGTPNRLSLGLPSDRILDLVRDWWKDGFDIPKREFGTLLEEMCGLGVLRRRPGSSGPAHYVFRNPNVLRLLGDIEEVLSKERDVPALFEASSYHAQYGHQKAGSPQRGPLTYKQEAQLQKGRRISVVCGTRAAGLSDVTTFLEERTRYLEEHKERTRWHPLKQSNDRDALAKELNRLRPPEHDTYLCVVAEDADWTMRWLERMAEALRTARRGDNFHVVFLADPDHLWRFMAELPDGVSRSRQQPIRLGSRATVECRFPGSMVQRPRPAGGQHENQGIA